ncbi:hypothetical protein PsorP6_007396 [Peronosclerospora sorghi]|uniref:Uncharacterized protein n=1 Tax=Peronosclerospora sorghi TaxID=230839 RepID=A0ACC0W7Q2_9STRA|nr:hypothetical protein PsorP6_007396 [Peronosclerospora sorghi]
MLLARFVALKGGNPTATLTNLGIGYLSELCHLPHTIAMELIMRYIVKESGVGGLYKGLGAYFLLCLQPAIQYRVFKRLKNAYLRKLKQDSYSLGAVNISVNMD